MKNFIICDLDDTLLKTDLLFEQWILLLKTKPLMFLQSLFWLFKGRAYFKNRIATLTSLSAATLPYRTEVIEVLKAYRSDSNNVLVLASASPTIWLDPIAAHLGLFDRTLGSSATTNLKGKAKFAALQEIIGRNSFTYIGDHEVDLEIWKHSTSIIAVNPSKSLSTKISLLKKETKTLIDPKRNIAKILAKQLRPHQWIKNILVFLPAVASHRYLDLSVLGNTLLGFASFSLIASFVYVLNDLLDLNADRAHHSKKNRPLACGLLPIRRGIAILPILFFGAVGIGFFLPPYYLGWLAVYLGLNIAYSFYLKQSVIIDVIILSFMYTLRIFAGSAATAIPISEWLLSFSTLFFFSLACVKRYTEISRSKNKLTIDGRGYRQLDHSMIQSLGVSSGMLSILVVLLYLQSGDVRALYANPQNLWFATPVLLFWISRIWLLTNRDEIHDDPVVFAVRDRVSWLCAVAIGLVFGASL